MKKILYLMLLSLLFSGAFVLHGQAHEELKMPWTEAAFSAEVFDFGTVMSGEIVSHHFFVKNIGSEPLRIYKVATSCGCTMASYSCDAIPPGEEATIEVMLNTSKRSGKESKTFTVMGNFGENGRKVLFLKGEAVEN